MSAVFATLFSVLAVFFAATAALMVHTEQWAMHRTLPPRVGAAAYVVLFTWIGLAAGCAFAALTFAAL